MKATRLLLVIVLALFLISVTSKSMALRSQSRALQADTEAQKKPEEQKKADEKKKADETDTDAAIETDQSDIDEAKDKNATAKADTQK